MAKWRRLWKVGCGILLVPVLAGGVFLVNLLWFKPFKIEHFFLRQTLAYGLRSPESLSDVAALPSFRGYPHGRLDDRSLEATQETLSLARDTLDTLHRYDRAKLSAENQASYDILEWLLEALLADERFLYYIYPVNQTFGIHTMLPSFMMGKHPVDGGKNARLYVERLQEFPRVFDQVVEGLRYRREMGVQPPRFVYEKSLAQVRELLAPKPTAHPLYTTLADKLKPLDIEDQEKREILAAAEQAVAHAVMPAYRKLAAYLESVLPELREDPGAWALPDGERFYAWMLRLLTTTDLRPEELHRLGLAEVARLEAEMDGILTAQGYTAGTVGARMRALSQDPRFLYAESDAGRKELVADIKAILREVDVRLRPVFNLRPRASIEVRRMPEFREASGPVATYSPSSLDSSRPGYLNMNLSKLHDLPRYAVRTLVYHEGIPGHHFQYAIQGELEDLPLFRTVAPFDAYMEGWGLYAEQLAAEQGLMDAPFDRLGFLQAALWRAVRLVVDTGIHQDRWTRQQAIDYMESTTGMPHNAVVNEIDRYIVAPGQACAYMVGKMKLLELRERARTALGERFSLAAFHDTILGGGAMPLDLLERHVDAWLAAQATPAR